VRILHLCSLRTFGLQFSLLASVSGPLFYLNGITDPCLCECMQQFTHFRYCLVVHSMEIQHIADGHVGCFLFSVDPAAKNILAHVFW
jgi:hypothetical protein